jgi:hypothetical protein
VFQPKVAPSATATTSVAAGINEKNKAESSSGSAADVVPRSVAQYESEYDIVAND